MKKKIVLWYDAWHEWFDSTITLISGVVIDYILLLHMPIRMNEGKLSLGEIVELFIVAIPLISLLYKLIKQLGKEKEHIDTYLSCSDQEKRMINDGCIKEDLKRKKQLRKNSIANGCTCVIACGSGCYLFTLLIEEVSPIYLLGFGIVLFYILALAANVGQHGVTNTISSIGNFTIEIVNDLADSIEISESQQENQSSRHMSGVGMQDEQYVAVESERYRYVEDRYGNEKRLYKADGSWWDEDGNQYEDI